MKLEELLQKEDPAYWEAAFRDFVQNGSVAIDEFIWQWLWYRITWSNGDYSLFYKDIRENVAQRTKYYLLKN